MQLSNVPAKSAIIFAESGAKNTIPQTASPTPGLASFTTGFPPVTMTPIVAGGIPPEGEDFNGILNFLSAAIQWAQSGCVYQFDATFATSVGGYPKGAILLNAAGNGFWVSTADNNSNNPDTGGANWVSLLTTAGGTMAGALALAAGSTAPTPAAGDNSTKLATTAFIQAAIGVRKATFTASSSFTVPAGATTLWFSGCPAGGAGGSGASGSSQTGAGGGGGGAGQPVLRQAATVSPGETLTITIPAGPSSGSGGNLTVVGSVSGALLTLTGGTVGTAGANTVGISAGGSGGAGYPRGSWGSDSVGGYPSGNGGDGASGPFGGGGGLGRGSSGGGVAGNAAYGYGAGGGGGGGYYTAGAGTGGAGGAGAPGYLLIEW